MRAVLAATEAGLLVQANRTREKRRRAEQQVCVALRDRKLLDVLKQQTPEPCSSRRRQDVIVGTVSAVPKGAACYVRSMAIVPAARGLGLGRLLLERVEAFAASQGHTYLLLSTTPFLARAIRLYEQVGFRRTADGPHDLYGTPLFSMVKPLKVTTNDQRPATTVDHQPHER